MGLPAVKKRERDIHMHPVTRALFLRDWTVAAVTGRIHAMIGGDSDKLVHGAGSIFFVVLGAALTQGMSAEHADIRILRGATNALAQQAGQPTVDESLRPAIVSGLDACERLLDELSPKALAESAIDLALRLRQGAVNWQQFEERITALKE